MSKYYGSVITQFENGCQLEFTAKLALDFVKVPSVIEGRSAKEAAEYAFDLAHFCVLEAEARKLVLPIPEDNGINSAMRKHIERQVRAQIIGNIAGQKIAAEEQPAVAIAPRLPDNGLHRQ
jgi:hypothetical protein